MDEGGLFHWWIVVGLPGLVPDPKLDENQSEGLWFRWRDGMYCWFPD